MAKTGRLARAGALAEQEGLSALILSHGSDLSYLTGYAGRPDERFCAVVIVPEEEPMLIAPGINGADARRTGIGNVLLWGDGDDPYELLRDALGKGFPRSCRIGVNDTMPARFLFGLKRAFPRAELVDGSGVIAPMRMIKDREELDTMARVSLLTEECMQAVVSRGRDWIGKTESSYQAAMAAELRERGLGGTGGLVQAGANAAEPHHRPGQSVIGNGACLLHDVGGILNGYHADMTRTLFFGEPTARFREVYSVVLEANLAAEASVSAGVPFEAIDRAARSVIEKAGYGPYFTHRTGHGIGLDGHEGFGPGKGVTEAVKPGMVFSVEPGVYLPGEFGIRIEDLMMIEEDGSVRCLNSFPKDLICL